MPEQESETVPNDQVSRIVQEFKDAGASVVTTPAGSGKTTITATFPDAASAHAHAVAAKIRKKSGK